MKKKLMAAILAMATMTGLLSGCGSSASDAAPAAAGAEGTAGESGVTTEDITLTYWHYEDETTINLLAEKFM